MHSEGILAGEMKHGPLALVDENMPIIVIATQDRMHAKMQSVIQQLRARNARLIVLCNEGDSSIASLCSPKCRLIQVSKHTNMRKGQQSLLHPSKMMCHLPSTGESALEFAGFAVECRIVTQWYLLVTSSTQLSAWCRVWVCRARIRHYQQACAGCVQVPEVDECVQAIVNIVPLQLLSYHLTLLRGHNVDQPRNLAKAVTVSEEG